MSETDFAPSTTTFDPQAEATAPDVNGAAFNQPTGEVDLNDPRFASEDTSIDLEGDAYAAPPPVPDGEYRAKLKQLDVEYPKGSGQMKRFAPWAKGDKVALFTKLEATIQDPSGKNDGLKVFDSWFSTYLQRDNSTKVSTMLAAAGIKPAAKTHAAIMDAALQFLAKEPDLGIVTQWEASCEKCREEADKTGSKRPRSLQGMQKFPMLANGTYDPNPVCTADAKHGRMSAQARIAGFKKLG
jgi:hypothetical protein